MTEQTTAPPQGAATHQGLLNTSEAAAYLGIGKRTLQERIRDHEIGFIKIGRAVRFDETDLRDFIARNRIKSRGWKGGTK